MKVYVSVTFSPYFCLVVTSKGANIRYPKDEGGGHAKIIFNLVTF